MNATLNSGPGYGVYFRSDGKPAISGYCFQFDSPSGGAGLRGWYGTDVGFISAKTLDGRSTGDGDPSKGDFAYAAGDITISYGLVGWMSGDGAFVVQPLH